jgi:hypothetical protein
MELFRKKKNSFRIGDNLTYDFCYVRGLAEINSLLLLLLLGFVGIFFYLEGLLGKILYEEVTYIFVTRIHRLHRFLLHEYIYYIHVC